MKGPSNLGRLAALGVAGAIGLTSPEALAKEEPPREEQKQEISGDDGKKQTETTQKAARAVLDCHLLQNSSQEPTTVDPRDKIRVDWKESRGDTIVAEVPDGTNLYFTVVCEDVATRQQLEAVKEDMTVNGQKPQFVTIQEDLVEIGGKKHGILHVWFQVDSRRVVSGSEGNESARRQRFELRVRNPKTDDYERAVLVAKIVPNAERDFQEKAEALRKRTATLEDEMKRQKEKWTQQGPRDQGQDGALQAEREAREQADTRIGERQNATDERVDRQGQEIKDIQKKDKPVDVGVGGYFQYPLDGDERGVGLGVEGKTVLGRFKGDEPGGPDYGGVSLVVGAGGEKKGLQGDTENQRVYVLTLGGGLNVEVGTSSKSSVGVRGNLGAGVEAAISFAQHGAILENGDTKRVNRETRWSPYGEVGVEVDGDVGQGVRVFLRQGLEYKWAPKNINGPREHQLLGTTEFGVKLDL